MKPLSSSQINKLNQLSRAFELDLLVLFGSRAKSEEHQNSDWDIAYKKDVELTYNEMTDFFSKLSSIVDSESLDLVDVERTYDPLLLREIFLGGMCLYEKQEGLFDEEQNKAWSAYLDFEPNYKLQEEIIRLRLEELTSK